MLRLAMCILWPSFLVAIVADGFFFSLFDPRDLLVVGAHAEVSPLAAYTIGFLFLWTFCALAAMLSQYLLKAPADSGREPF
jgi:hypothetical protein